MNNSEFPIDWNNFIQVKKFIHHMWYQYPKVKLLGIPNMVGKYQYEFKSPKGKVSMIRYNDYDYDDYSKRKWRWEIYSHETLFEDIERYDTWKEIRERIKQVLSPDLNW